ncbi:MAG: MarR family transcriptional regulator [Armatimonadetes bacterium]|nr:MarR family transcriptional regulator [Anaerolineae bacterium]
MTPGEELRYLILAVQREGNRQLSEVLRTLNITPAQAEVLLVLQHYQPLTLVELGERLVCEAGSPSRLVKSMVEAGWVEKSANPNDGRAVHLRLSPVAQQMLPMLNTLDQQFNATVAATFDSRTLVSLIEMLWLAAADTPSGQALLRRKQNQ